MNTDRLTSAEQTTISYYDQNALDWSNRHGLVNPESYFKKDMSKLFRLLPQGRILEIGTGHGGDAQKLIKQYGLDNYIGIDASSGLLKIARKRNPGANLFKRSIYNIKLPANSVDGFWVSAVFVHLPKRRIQEALKNINNVTKKGGFGFISLMEGSVDMEESRPGRFFSMWTHEEFKSELDTAGFQIVNKREHDPGISSLSPWLAYIVQKL